MPYKDPEKRRIRRRQFWAENKERLRDYHRRYRRKWRAENGDHEREVARLWYASTPEKQMKKRKKRKRYTKDYQRQYYANNAYVRDKARAANRKRRYGISNDQVLLLLKGQDYKCAISDCTIGVDIKSPIDHDHNTGLARGILCQRHNALLGWLEILEKDNIRLKLLKYLECTPVKGLGIELDV